MTTSTGRSTGRWLTCAIVMVAALAAWPAAVSSAAASGARPMWTGFYIGFHGGGGWSDSRINDPSFALMYDPIHVKVSGALAGVQTGADWQFGPVVIGGEFDASWSSLRGEERNDWDVFSGEGQRVTFVARYRALMTGTLRVGYASGGWLGYVKGGVAFADIKFETVFDGGGPQQSPGVHHFRTGLTGGVGVEVMLFRNLSGKLEYNAMYFGQSSINAGSRGPLEVDHMLHVVKAGLNLRFGGDSITARH